MRLQGTISTYLLSTARHSDCKNFFIATNKTVNQFLPFFRQITTLLNMTPAPFSIILYLTSAKFPSFFNSSNTSVSHFTSFNSPTNQCKGVSSILNKIRKKNHFCYVKIRMKHITFSIHSKSIGNVIIPVTNQVILIR